MKMGPFLGVFNACTPGLMGWWGWDFRIFLPGCGRKTPIPASAGEILMPLELQFALVSPGCDLRMVPTYHLNNGIMGTT
jgi:hypothetical protein